MILCYVIEVNLLGVSYQLQIWMLDGVVVGFEVFVCWYYFELGEVLFEVFILLVEKFGYIGLIGVWVLWCSFVEFGVLVGFCDMWLVVNVLFL